MAAAPTVPSGRPESVRRRRRSALLALALAAPAVGGVLASGTASAGVGIIPPQLSVIAGTGTSGVPVPGAALSSPLKDPEGVAVDAAGNVYVADYRGNVVEKVTPAGVLSVVAGTGTAGAEVPGPATSSPLHGPYKLAVSAAGDLYIADYSNYDVVKVTPGGVLSVVAGTGTNDRAVPGTATSSPLGGPEALAFDGAGDLYIADWNNDTVEEVTPAGELSIVAGIQGTSAAPTPGPATASALGGVEGLGLDAAGNLYLADGRGNKLIEKVTPSGTLSVVAGKLGNDGVPTPGPAATSTVGYPEDLAVAADGTLYVADDSNEVVERITPTGQLSVYAGIVGNYQAPVPGAASMSPVGDPNGVAVAADGTLYIADDQNDVVEKVRPAATLAVTLTVRPTRAAAGQKVLFSGRVTLDGVAAPRAPITIAGLDANGDRYTVARNVTRADGSFSGYASSPYDDTLTATSGAATASARFTVRVGIADRVTVTGHTVVAQGATVPGYRGDAAAVSTALVTVDSRGRFLRVLQHGRLQPYRTVVGLPYGANPFVIGAVLRPGTYRIAVAVAGTPVNDPSYGPATVVSVR